MDQLLLTNRIIADVRPLLSHERAEQKAELSCACAHPEIELIHDTSAMLQQVYWDQVFYKYPLRSVIGFTFDKDLFPKADPCYVRCTNCGRRYSMEWFPENAVLEWQAALDNGILSEGYGYSIILRRFGRCGFIPEISISMCYNRHAIASRLWFITNTSGPAATVMLETYNALGQMGATTFQGLHAATIGAARLGWPEDKTVKVPKLYQDPVKQSIIERFARFFGLSKGHSL